MYHTSNSAKVNYVPSAFWIGVELNKTFGSEWLVDHISRLGYCIWYDEVLRYKQKVWMEFKIWIWVTENVDHNIKTLTGKGTFHRMGTISVTQPGGIRSDKLVT